MSSGSKILADIVHGTFQDKDCILEYIELIPGDDQFVLRQVEFCGPLSCHPVPLTTFLAAELAWSPGTLGWCKDVPTPSTARTLCARLLCPSWQFRHDDIVEHYTDAMVMPPAPERQFASDNFAGIHPQYLDAIAAANGGHVRAYGGDAVTARAKELFRDLCGMDVEVLFCFNGTGANVVALSCLLGRGESVVCTQWSHIHVDETGAPERILGVKLQDMPAPDAKVTPLHLHQLAGALGNVHHVQPGVVSITQATELGTLYSIDEIRELCTVAHSYGMRVHLDGARISNAVAALGGDAATFRAMTFDAGVDAVSFGGTKNGMVNAEAVLLRPGFAEGRSEFLRKQATQLPSKMRFTAAQFASALESGLWLETAAQSNAMATRLYAALSEFTSLGLWAPEVNSLYPVLSPEARQQLQDWSFFWDWDETTGQVRWMTSWDTTDEDVDRFVAGVRAVLS